MYFVLTQAPAYADSSETTAALCMRISALLMFRVKPNAAGDIAHSDNWWPCPSSGHYGLDQLGLAIANPESLIVMSVLHALLCLHYPTVLTTRPFM